LGTPPHSRYPCPCEDLQYLLCEARQRLVVGSQDRDVGTSAAERREHIGERRAERRDELVDFPVAAVLYRMWLGARADPRSQDVICGVECQHQSDRRAPTRERLLTPARQDRIVARGRTEDLEPAEHQHGTFLHEENPLAVYGGMVEGVTERMQPNELAALGPGESGGAATQLDDCGQRVHGARREPWCRHGVHAQPGAYPGVALGEQARQRALPCARRTDQLDDQGAVGAKGGGGRGTEHHA